MRDERIQTPMLKKVDTDSDNANNTALPYCGICVGQKSASTQMNTPVEF